MSDEPITKAELEGYINGLGRACNLRPRIKFGAEGANVLEDLRAQMIAEIERAPQLFSKVRGQQEDK